WIRCFFFQAEDGIRDFHVTGVQTCALPIFAARALRIAEDDWRHAIAGVEGPETWSTPAYRAMPIELAGIGITASLELWRATGGQIGRASCRGRVDSPVVGGSRETSAEREAT